MSEAWLPVEMWDYAVNNGDPHIDVISDPDLGALAYIVESSSVIVVSADNASY